MKSAKKRMYIQTRYGRHLCSIEPDEKKGLIVTALDLPGVITWGKDIAHAKEMAKEAIELCIECIAEKAILGRSKKHIREHVAVAA